MALVLSTYLGNAALLSHNTLKRSAILGLCFFVQSWWPRESVLKGSSELSELCTSLSKVWTLWHCVKVKQLYLSLTYDFLFWRFKKTRTKGENFVSGNKNMSQLTVWPEIDKVFSKTKCIQHFSELPHIACWFLVKVSNKPDFLVNLDFR